MIKSLAFARETAGSIWHHTFALRLTNFPAQIRLWA